MEVGPRSWPVGEFPEWMKRALQLISPATKEIDYLAAFELDGPHEFKFIWRYEPALLRLYPLRFEIHIDGEILLEKRIGNFSWGVRRHWINVAGHALEISWKLNYLVGAMDYVHLSDGSRMLAWYDRSNAIHSIQKRLPPVAAPSRITRLEIKEPITEDYEAVEFDREEYPLDNSFGSDMLSIQQEITRTITTEFGMTAQIELSGQVGAKVLEMIKAELGAKVAVAASAKFGETVTRRQQIEFQVKPKEKVTYTVIWKRRIRKGQYSVEVDRNLHAVGYRAVVGLTFEVTSRPG
jgi:hypothetical protein